MPLQPGTRLGPYEITSAIGAGGMGEVYRARDQKLQRDVAIKVLPELFSADPDRLARFEREAQSLAALNHPNIAQVFGVLENPPALAMELVEGEDLSQRIASGPIPAEDALPIALQIADALEAAHERGIIHRDLKPANVKVRADGTVKVLDFGLAKSAVVQGFSPADTGSPKGLDYERNSPTFTTPAMTQIGVILGTAAYMAPEQARGRVVDRRADIWAFGCVLFEMLTGKRPFGGDDVTDTIASIVKDEPEWRLLPPNLPPAIVSLLHRCLQKDARRRLRDIGDARVDIADVIEGKRILPAVAPVAVRTRFARAPWIAAALIGAALLGGATTWLVTRQRAIEQPPAPIVRFELAPAPGVLNIPNVALAPDSSFLVYEGDSENETSLFIHRFDSGAVSPVRGTSGARWPFVSPDGKWVAFFRAGKIEKISLAGGDPLTLCDANGGPGAVWLADGRIVFSGSWLSGLFAVPSDGGKPTPLTTPDAAKREKGHWWPAALPDGSVIFTIFMAGAGLNDNRIAVLPAASDKYQTLMAGARASWLPSGHILFYRAGRYQVVPIDLKSMRVTGEPALVLDDAMELDPAGDWPQPVVVSATGALAYVPGPFSPDGHLAWIADGRMTPLPLPVRPYVSVGLSPRGDQTAVAILEGGRLSLRLVDLARGVDTALDLDGMTWDPIWHSDGRRLSFTTMRKGDFDIFMKDVTGPGRETPVVEDGMDSTPSAWTPDGRLVFQASSPEGVYTLKLLDPRSPGAVTPLTTSRTERLASVSPDGKWLAFVSPREGRAHVYVQPLLGTGQAVRVSALGAENPIFRPQGRELYVRRGAQLIAIPWEEKDGRFLPAGERVIAKVPWIATTFGSTYGVTPDGRVLALTAVSEPPPPRINVVLNWAQGLGSR